MYLGISLKKIGQIFTQKIDHIIKRYTAQRNRYTIFMEGTPQCWKDARLGIWKWCPARADIWRVDLTHTADVRRCKSLGSPLPSWTLWQKVPSFSETACFCLHVSLFLSERICSVVSSCLSITGSSCGQAPFTGSWLEMRVVSEIGNSVQNSLSIVDSFSQQWPPASRGGGRCKRGIPPQGVSD